MKRNKEIISQFNMDDLINYIKTEFGITIHKMKFMKMTDFTPYSLENSIKNHLFSFEDSYYFFDNINCLYYSLNDKSELYSFFECRFDEE